MTVRELLARMDSQELAEWQAYLSLDHFKERIAENALDVDEQSTRLEDALFGRAKAKEKQDTQSRGDNN